ncbi:translation initiation factor IF-1A [Fervidicoccus fontis]|uniref:Translation initiation factor 1A n=2 Tax=Fervidicoccus fontis TaxID=683846 RepID=I0A1E8_FERFK|nr:translation initiation factor aIF-1A [Fervidicoccus fontis]AFH42805.1 translation initiation factor IF-1A [Fervidicoccus fontis Kam940]MBE9391591.1 translation initiation factor IF-1A [Fervidicoccus fontis]PMB76308.1 MAG: translation initiation factor IF-1A [Fervidicoccus fontis]HEW63775.1 translation initiation factor IF-1A [Fervidicoccus fontis]
MSKKEEGSRNEFPRPDESSVVCVVEKILGGDHFIAKCSDGKKRLTRIPGRLRRKMWIKERDVVLVAPWDMQSDTKADLLYKYSNNEVRKLVQEKLIPPELLEGA